VVRRHRLDSRAALHLLMIIAHSATHLRCFAVAPPPPRCSMGNYFPSDLWSCYVCRPARTRRFYTMSENDPADVAEAVRRKIAAGILPTRIPDRMWVGHGTGRTCDACDLQITSEDIEHELDLRNGRTLRLHQRCLTVWREESGRRQR
jgi:hypothetical protein